jgi:hypothetical protein
VQTVEHFKFYVSIDQNNVLNTRFAFLIAKEDPYSVSHYVSHVIHCFFYMKDRLLQICLNDYLLPRRNGGG